MWTWFLDLLFKSSQQRGYERFLKVLEVFANNPDDWYTGADICNKTKLVSGTVYPLLIRMEQRGWLTSKWKADLKYLEPPTRCFYRITRGGAGRGKRMLAKSKEVPEDFSLGDLVPA